jgi:hypothetical protein
LISFRITQASDHAKGSSGLRVKRVSLKPGWVLAPLPLYGGALRLLSAFFEWAAKQAMKWRCGHRVHGSFFFDSFVSETLQASANSFRARASRDMTVPMGTPVTSAISR